MVGRRHVRFASRSSKKSLLPASKKKQAKHEVKEDKQQIEEQPRNSFSSSDTVLAPPIACNARALSSQHSACSSDTTLSACPAANRLGDAAQHKSKEPEQATEEQPRKSSGFSDTSLSAYDAHQSQDHKAALQRPRGTRMPQWVSPILSPASPSPPEHRESVPCIVVHPDNYGYNEDGYPKSPTPSLMCSTSPTPTIVVSDTYGVEAPSTSCAPTVVVSDSYAATEASLTSRTSTVVVSDSYIAVAPPQPSCAAVFVSNAIPTRSRISDSTALPSTPPIRIRNLRNCAGQQSRIQAPLTPINTPQDTPWPTHNYLPHIGHDVGQRQGQRQQQPAQVNPVARARNPLPPLIHTQAQQGPANPPQHDQPRIRRQPYYARVEAQGPIEQIPPNSWTGYAVVAPDVWKPEIIQRGGFWMPESQRRRNGDAAMEQHGREQEELKPGDNWQQFLCSPLGRTTSREHGWDEKLGR